MTKFYAYLYSDPFSGEVFYVGKGQGGRFKEHLKRPKTHNVMLTRRIQKIRGLGLEPVVSVVQADDERHAFEMEKALISLIGRRDLGAGALLNFTDGGEGPSGQRFSDESKEKMSRAHKGRKPTEEARRNQSAAQKGRKASEEHRRAISEALKGKKRAPEHSAAISAAKKGKPVPPEVLAAAVVANLGRPKPREEVERAAAKRRGVQLSEQHRANVSAGVKDYYRRAKDASHV